MPADDLKNAMAIAASGMKVQTQRLKVIAENVANANAVASDSQTDPYKRKYMTFKSVFNRERGVDLVKVDQVKEDNSDFKLKYEPTHPAADNKGYVKVSNVNVFLEMMNWKQAQRTYEANISAYQAAKSMASETLRLLRN